MMMGMGMGTGGAGDRGPSPVLIDSAVVRCTWTPVGRHHRVLKRTSSALAAGPSSLPAAAAGRG